MPLFSRPPFRAPLAGASLIALTACGGFDLDLRDRFGDAFDTSDAVRQEHAPRPQPDDRGVISYTGYQVAIARHGDTLADVAARVGADPARLSQYNAISPDAPLRDGEVIILPDRVAELAPATDAITTGPIRAPGEIDVETIAGDALSRVAPDAAPQTGSDDPLRHRVERGETAYSVARLYGVTVDALAGWNGLGQDRAVREGQVLLIPVAPDDRRAVTESEQSTSRPGAGTPTPEPPSASTPLPEDDTATPVARPDPPPSPGLSEQRSAASRSELLFPLSGGDIIRPYEAGGNAGIDIAAPAGTEVRAAGDGTVAAITRDTENVPVLVIRHEGNLLTVYANIDNIVVERGQAVSRGDKIAEVRGGSPSFIRFETRRGFDVIDPMPLLN